jgi:bifunctional ADP-heptose synthase (sugar kinase/adenylyltransferase)
MTTQRFAELLDRFRGVSVAVVGDYFVDRYLVIDPALSVPSVETGLDAYQIVARRMSPGAAGTVVGNLHALGVGAIEAAGVTGADGGESFYFRLDHGVSIPNLYRRLMEQWCT